MKRQVLFPRGLALIVHDSPHDHMLDFVACLATDPPPQE